MKYSLSPSDVDSFANEGEFLLSGRLAFVSEGTLVLADAISAVNVSLEGGVNASPGDLLTLRVQDRKGHLFLLEVKEHTRAPESRGDGEFSRLSAGRGALLKARSRAMQTIRRYFDEADFIEVQTPTFVPCPGLDAHVDSLAPVKRAGRVHHLITSPEFHMKRLLTGGMPRIYQLARCFRAEEHGRDHEPEFTMLEWYRAFCTYEAMLIDTEEIVSRVFSALGNGGSYPGGELKRPFLRMTVREAFSRFAGEMDAIELALTDEDRYFRLLVDKVEPGLASLGQPVFLTHYPLAQAALARACPKDGSVAERFELYLGQKELCNGFGELTCGDTQRARFEKELARREANDEPIYPIDEKFLSALREGMPPSCGNALGLDRLIGIATGSPTIGETLAFADDER